MSYVYNKLTIEDIDKVIKSMFIKSYDYSRYTIYTGIIGHIIIDLTLLSSYYDIPLWNYKTLGKHSKYDLVLNIGTIEYKYKSGKVKKFSNSHSNLKIYFKIKSGWFTVYNGTTYLFETKELTGTTFENIKKLKL